MLHELALENFKPFGTKQVAKLSNITLIYGPNSGGVFKWADESWRSFARYAAEAEDRRGVRRPISQADLSEPTGNESHHKELRAMLADSVVLARRLLPGRINFSPSTGERGILRSPSVIYRISAPLESLV